MEKVLLILFFILFPLPLQAADQRVEVPLEGAPSRGPADAPVTMIEFIDFQ